MTNKKKSFLVIIAVSAVILIIGILIAYFSAKSDEPNLMAVGENEISVTEEFTPPNQSENFSYRKLVKIENTGSIPCYIRVRMEFSNSAVENAASFSSANQEGNTPPDGSTFKSAQIKQGPDYYINNLPDGWVYVSEDNAGDYTPSVTTGYYYYTKKVDPGKATDALISWVKMAYGTTEIQAHEVYVYSESVQSIDPNTSTDYADWKDAWNKFAG